MNDSVSPLMTGRDQGSDPDLFVSKGTLYLIKQKVGAPHTEHKAIQLNGWLLLGPYFSDSKSATVFIFFGGKTETYHSRIKF